MATVFSLSWIRLLLLSTLALTLIDPSEGLMCYVCVVETCNPKSGWTKHTCQSSMSAACTTSLLNRNGVESTTRGCVSQQILDSKLKTGAKFGACTTLPGTTTCLCKSDLCNEFEDARVPDPLDSGTASSHSPLGVTLVFGAVATGMFSHF